MSNTAFSGPNKKFIAATAFSFKLRIFFKRLMFGCGGTIKKDILLSDKENRKQSPKIKAHKQSGQREVRASEPRDSESDCTFPLGRRRRNQQLEIVSDP